MVMGMKNWSVKKKERFWGSWKLSSAFKWKKPIDFQVKIIDNLVFRVLYVVEAVVLVSTLCFFYLCCGCNI
ncbi:hypothetical protein CXB51_027807 [Gossypium anomalum]|uniref:Transmembrane protein n=7 Tax=Gossypium TaxID=3633 RepID=A0ABR0N1C4_GOSAR|nr:hypothetical protein ES319_D11G171400v1 [Gossypium barbadense]KAG4120761.1 hypothetical protein ERO13_D11G163600v2 [Gossypium hirsutum]KAG8478009.1 hypothetical protein CXB51_027807 [Gossypium anomalum]KAK5784354.1 hypothetical protein PVK06_038877 [Gossypium arboreum]KJB42928.1 hypothetical protein B456_007G174300 [Gossypium raimondii]TYG45523.1 hypothetical protein ES288_D11G181000v1 [Gossypium darwinii]TYH44211.1 hypothetical protein ES332_D11G178100v1 [Gossypium tomentosum]TYI55942.1 